MTSFIGIDLGTTYSAVATIDETGRPVIVHNAEGENITPSCVVETSSGVMEVGEFARRQWGSAPDTAASRFKRDMGTSTTHSINGEEFTPTQLSTFILKKLLQETKSSLGEIGEAVVTIPANFAHEARDATMAAAKEAGLNVKYIINEPTAAALYYAFKNGEDLSGVYAVYDLGGGTFDVSIIRVDGQDIEVMATNGVHKLGGDDFDAALQKLVQAKFKEITGEDLEEDDFTKNDAEEQKKSLSKRKQITFRVAKQMVDVKRDEFEEIISTFITQAEMLCEATIGDAGINVDDVKGVFIAGGSTRIPLVTESITKIFNQEPISTVNVDEVVALGAALYAAFKGDQSKLSTVQQNAIKKIQVSETTGKCFGTIAISHNDSKGEIEKVNSIIIKKGHQIPCSVTESFYTTYEGQEAINCTVTESTAAETDPRFVNIIYEGSLDLPPNRPENQEIKVTFSYDDNQVMKCSFVDVGTGKKEKIDLTMTAQSESSTNETDKFVVE